MEQTEHALLVGKGADDFVRATGAEMATKEELVTDAARNEWERFTKYRKVR